MNSITRICSAKDCGIKHFAKNYCKKHYYRVKINGTIVPKNIHGNEVASFWQKVNKTDTCWLWTGATARANYGSFRSKRVGKTVQSHRYSYELHKGKIPEGLQLDHLCRNSLCVNPDHLEPVTVRENIVRGAIVLDKKSELPVGVHHNRNATRFQATKSWAGITFYVGTFDTPEEASIAYQTAILVIPKERRYSIK